MRGSGEVMLPDLRRVISIAGILCDKSALSLDAVQKAVIAQIRDGLTKRRPADAEQLHQLNLGRYLRAARPLSFDNFVSHVVFDLIIEG